MAKEQKKETIWIESWANVPIIVNGIRAYNFYRTNSINERQY